MMPHPNDPACIPIAQSNESLKERIDSLDDDFYLRHKEGIDRMIEQAVKSLNRLGEIAQKKNTEFQEQRKAWKDEPVTFRSRPSE